MFNQDWEKHAVLSVYVTRDNFKQQRAAKGDHDAVVTRRIMLNAHLPTGSRQLALSPTAD